MKKQIHLLVDLKKSDNNMLSLEEIKNILPNNIEVWALNSLDIIIVCCLDSDFEDFKKLILSVYPKAVVSKDINTKLMD